MIRERRPAVQIYFDILVTIKKEIPKYEKEKIKLTRVQLGSKLSYDNLKGLLKVLEDMYLIEDNKNPKITEKGKKFMKVFVGILKAQQKVNSIFLNTNKNAIDSMAHNLEGLLELEENLRRFFPIAFGCSSNVEMVLKDMQQVSNAKDAIIEALEMQIVKI